MTLDRRESDIVRAELPERRSGGSYGHIWRIFPSHPQSQKKWAGTIRPLDIQRNAHYRHAAWPDQSAGPARDLPADERA
jgi:hypothetical protein